MALALSMPNMMRRPAAVRLQVAETHHVRREKQRLERALHGRKIPSGRLRRLLQYPGPRGRTEAEQSELSDNRIWKSGRMTSKVLWFHPRPLFPARGGGDRRTLGLISAALLQGHEILLVQPEGDLADCPPGLRVVSLPMRAGLPRAVAKIVSRHPLRSARVTARGLRSARREIQTFGPDVAVVGEVFSWCFASRLLPEVPWIYDAHNVESELFRSFAKRAQSLVDRATFTVDRRRVTVAEERLLTAANAVTAVSAEDAQGLREIRSQTRVVEVPSSVPTPGNVSSPGGAAPIVMFVGSLDFPPNVDALNELVTQIMPIVRRSCVAARLLVVGHHPSRRLRDLLASERWIEFREDLSDLTEAYLHARVTVLPLRTGSGTRVKVYEALSFGLPIVATPKAVSGLAGAGDVALVESDESDLAEAAIKVLTDDLLAERLGSAGRQLFLDELAWDRSAKPMLLLLEELMAASAE